MPQLFPIAVPLLVGLIFVSGQLVALVRKQYCYAKEKPFATLSVLTGLYLFVMIAALIKGMEPNSGFPLLASLIKFLCMLNLALIALPNRQFWNVLKLSGAAIVLQFMLDMFQPALQTDSWWDLLLHEWVVLPWWSWLALAMILFGIAELRKDPKEVHCSPVWWSRVGMLVWASLLLVDYALDRSGQLNWLQAFAVIPYWMVTYGLWNDGTSPKSHLLQSTEFQFSLRLSFWMPLLVGVLQVANWQVYGRGVNWRVNLQSDNIPLWISLVACLAIPTIVTLNRRLRPAEVLSALLIWTWGLQALNTLLLNWAQPSALLEPITRFNHGLWLLQPVLMAYLALRTGMLHNRAYLKHAVLLLGIGLITMIPSVSSWLWSWFGSDHVPLQDLLMGLAVLLMILISISALFLRPEGEFHKNRLKSLSLRGAITFIPWFGLLFLLQKNDFISGLVPQYWYVPAALLSFAVFSQLSVLHNRHRRIQLSGQIVFTVTVVGWSGWLMLTGYCLYQLGVELLLERLVIHQFPALISVLVCMLISWFSLRLLRNQPAIQLFALVSLGFGVLNLDIWMNMMIDDPQMGLWISRLDHSYLILMLGFFLHMVYLVLGQRQGWKWVWAAYVLGLLTLPFVSTHHYFTQMRDYGWGQFAQSGWLMQLWGLLWVGCLIYVVRLLFVAQSSESNPFQKHRVLFLAVGSLGVVVLTLGNYPATRGIPLHPLGNFACVPLLLMAWGMFYTNQAELRRLGREVLYVLTLLVMLLSPWWLVEHWLPEKLDDWMYLVGAVLLLVASMPIHRLTSIIINYFVGDQLTQFKERLAQLHDQLTSAKNHQQLFESLKDAIHLDLKCSHWVMLSQGQMDEPYQGWEVVHPTTNYFSPKDQPLGRTQEVTLSYQHPLLAMLNQPAFKGQGVDGVQIESWIHEHRLVLSEGDLLRNAMYLQPIVYQGRLVGLLVFDIKIDGTHFSALEVAFINDLGRLISPYLIQCDLTHTMESQVQQRTQQLQQALTQSKLKESEIKHWSAVMRQINSTLELDAILKVLVRNVLTHHQIEGTLVYFFNVKTAHLELDTIHDDHLDQQDRAEIAMFCHSANDIEQWFDKEATDLGRHWFTASEEIPLEMAETLGGLMQTVNFQGVVIIPLIIQDSVLGALCCYSRTSPLNFTVEEQGQLQQQLAQFLSAINNARLYQVVREQQLELEHQNNTLEQLSVKLSKYLSPQVYRSIFTGKRDVSLDASRKRLTVCFASIASFNEIVESMEFETITFVLNSFLKEMSKIALIFGGTVGNFLGDGLMVFFGDPESKGVEKDALACVRMALKMRENMKLLRQSWHAQGVRQALQIRIGINTGYCTVGNFGSETLLEYTAIGEQVNFAARLQRVTKGGEVLVLPETFGLIKNHFECEALESSMLGWDEDVNVFRVMRPLEHGSQPEDPFHVQTEHVSLNINWDLMQEGNQEVLLKQIRQLKARLQRGHLAEEHSEAIMQEPVASLSTSLEPPMQIDAPGFKLKIDPNQVQPQQWQSLIHQLRSMLHQFKQLGRNHSDKA